MLKETTHCSKQENLWQTIPQYDQPALKWDFSLEDEKQKNTAHLSICQSIQRNGQVRLPVLIWWFIIITRRTTAATNNDLFHYKHLKSFSSFSKHFDVHYRICSPGLYLRKDGKWLNGAKGTKWWMKKVNEWSISRERHEERELNCLHRY